jgi:hypothetical protein
MESHTGGIRWFATGDLETVELFVAWLDRRPEPLGEWREVAGREVAEWVSELRDRLKPASVLTRYAAPQQ